MPSVSKFLDILIFQSPRYEPNHEMSVENTCSRSETQETSVQLIGHDFFVPSSSHVTSTRPIDADINVAVSNVGF